jgi:hypothetical protein
MQIDTLLDEIIARDEYEREAVDKILGEVVVLTRMQSGDWINFNLAHPDVKNGWACWLCWNVAEKRFPFGERPMHPYFVGKVLDMVKNEGLL